jgi:hypothetical protein
VDLVDEDLHDQEAHQHVEEHPDLDDQGDAVRAQHREEGDPVLQHEEADHLGERLLAGDDHEQADEDQAHRQRHPGAGRQVAELHDRPHHDVGEEDEQAADEERGRGVHVGRDLPLGAEAAGHAAEEQGDPDPLERDQQPGHPVQLRVAREVRDQRGGRGERNRLEGEGVDVRGEPAAPQQQESRDEHDARSEHRELGERAVHRAISTGTTR